MDPEELFAFVFILGMFSGVFIVFLGLRQRSQLMEMQHRERMAQIERGQIPLSEPTSARHRAERHVSTRNAPADRSLSLGIIVVGLGVALMTIISIAGESPEAGVGVGGAIAILGAAFIVRSFVVRSDTSTHPAPMSHSPTLARHDVPPPPDDRAL